MGELGLLLREWPQAVPPTTLIIYLKSTPKYFPHEDYSWFGFIEVRRLVGLLEALKFFSFLKDTRFLFVDGGKFLKLLNVSGSHEGEEDREVVEVFRGWEAGKVARVV